MIKYIYIFLSIILIAIVYKFCDRHFKSFREKFKIYLYLVVIILLSLFSIFSIWKNDSLNEFGILFWMIVISFLVFIIYLVYQKKILPIVEDENPFIEMKEQQIQSLVKNLSDNHYCKSADGKEETLFEIFNSILNNKFPENTLIWTHKYNNQKTYNGLLCFFKLTLKDNYYNLKFLKKIMTDIGIKFESDEYNNKILQDINEGSLKQSFEKLKFSELNSHQESVYNQLNDFCNKSL